MCAGYSCYHYVVCLTVKYYCYFNNEMWMDFVVLILAAIGAVAVFRQFRMSALSILRCFCLLVIRLVLFDFILLIGI